MQSAKAPITEDCWGRMTDWRFLLSAIELRYANSLRRFNLSEAERLFWEATRWRFKSLAKNLASALADGSYQPSSVGMTLAVLDKPRQLLRWDPVDLIFQTALAQCLESALEQHRSSRVYSFIKGRSAGQALIDFRQFLARHRAHTELKQRGLYVLRRDVKAFGESVPTGKAQPLWQMLQPHVPARFLALLRQFLQPLVREASGDFCSCAGLPTGSPLVPVLTNLYLGALETALPDDPQAFYARFGDDLLFAHPNAEAARHYARKIEETLDGLGLRINREKAVDLFFNGAGRAGAAGFRPTQRVAFLGRYVDFKGAIGLRHDKTKALLGELTAALSTLPVDSAAGYLRSATDIARGMLLPGPFRHPRVTELLRETDDRRQLRALDYQIARAILRRLPGGHRVTVFREVSLRNLRETFQLPSLEFLRNAG